MNVSLEEKKDKHNQIVHNEESEGGRGVVLNSLHGGSIA